ncbi:MAG: polysaccharide deacetylase family protein, partial [Nanoarchaeota archaeon]
KLSKEKLLELQKSLGFKVNHFAYPKGIVNDRILKFVKKAGFRFAYTTKPGVINSKTNPLLIPRIVIDKSRNISDFPNFLSEGNLLINKFFEDLGIWKTFSILK